MRKLLFTLLIVSILLSLPGCMIVSYDEPLHIVVSCEITKGNARLVLVIDDKIVHSFALNEENQQLSLNNVTGKVCLKLAGETTGYTVTYKLK